jgi:uncharacterized membrane protein YgdD (TMEM256/DUF423 family)
LAVGFGAFGAHLLRPRLSPDGLAIFETAVRYQMYHALALLAVALAVGRLGDAPLLMLAGWLFVVGMILFSGSLYVLALSGVKGFGAVAPVGGLALLLGWGALVMMGLR